MTLPDLAAALIETTLATSAAILLVLSLRRPLRALCGSRATYALWALVPAAWLAVLLPGPLRQMAAPDPSSPVAIVATLRPLIDASPGIDLTPWALLLWAAGLYACVHLLTRRQRGFMRSLGALRECGEGMVRAETSAGLPAVIGLLPKIVLPADFDTRYEDEERRLILAHERVHAARGDLFANLLAAALRCLYWFNPLLHFAVDRFRRDQELACDESVIAQHPQSRRAYGEAMLKTQLSAAPVPLACHWFGTHPLKERIAMLKSATPTARRWISGTLFAIAASTVGAYAAWAAQPSTPAPQALTMAARGMPVSEAAEKVAARAGLRIVNPEVFDPSRKVSFDFDKIPAEIALNLIGQEIGYRPEIAGGSVRFVKLTPAELQRLPPNGAPATSAMPDKSASVNPWVKAHQSMMSAVPDGVTVARVHSQDDALVVDGVAETMAGAATFLSRLEKTGWEADMTSMVDTKKAIGQPYAFTMKAKPPQG